MQTPDAQSLEEDQPGLQRWTTQTLYDGWRKAHRWVTDAQQGGGRLLDEDLAGWAVEASGLDDEQAAAVAGIATSGRRCHLLVGPAGAGKTRTMRAVGALADTAGIPLRAMTVAQKATDLLADELGVPDERARNIAAFLSTDHDETETGGWWIVDEASMVSTVQWADLVDRTGATIIAVGDPQQLGAIEPGGLFAAFVEDTDLVHHELETVRRMEEQWERDTSLQLRNGSPAAVDTYAAHGRLRPSADIGAILDETAHAINGGEDALVLAATNGTVDWLNNQLQQRIVDKRDPTDEIGLGWTDGYREHRSRTIGVGDLIRTRLNDYQLQTSARRPVLNGSTWTVLQVRPEGLWVESTDGRGRILLDDRYLDRRIEATGRPTVELGWASTVHSAQGRTVDRAAMVVDETTSSEALYVGMSRGRTANVAVGGDDVEELAELMKAAASRPTASVAIIDHHQDDDQQQHDEATARKAARERAERAAAEKEARELAERAAVEAARRARAVALREMVAGLDDGLDQLSVIDAAEAAGGGMDPTDAVDAYGKAQAERAKEWVRARPAGLGDVDVARVALERFAVGRVADPGRWLRREYADAAEAEVAEATDWLWEHSREWNDNDWGDRADALTQQFRLTPEWATGVVDQVDDEYRAAAAKFVKDLDEGLTETQARTRVVEEWHGTRYVGDAFGALQDRYRPPKRETPEQGLGGHDYGW